MYAFKGTCQKESKTDQIFLESTFSFRMLSRNKNRTFIHSSAIYFYLIKKWWLLAAKASVQTCFCTWHWSIWLFPLRQDGFFIRNLDKCIAVLPIVDARSLLDLQKLIRMMNINFQGNIIISLENQKVNFQSINKTNILFRSGWIKPSKFTTQISTKLWIIQKVKKLMEQFLNAIISHATLKGLTHK